MPKRARASSATHAEVMAGAMRGIVGGASVGSM